MNLTVITDDLSGAADSGSYFTERGQRLRIYTSGEEELKRESGEIISVNLSSRNTEGAEARRRHYELCRSLPEEEDRIFMKKIGTGFRGNDAFELEGMLQACPDYLCFIVDHAPDLGTFTLYGHQYCEGQILHKSLYAKDPIMPPTKSYIPEILAEHTDIKIATVDIDAVKGGRVLEATERALESGARIVVFDAVSKADTLVILEALVPVYKNVFWTGSLGIADGLAQYLYGDVIANIPRARDVRCLCFSASAYEMAKRQIAWSAGKGLNVCEIDIDALIDGDESVIEKCVERAGKLLEQGNTIVVPRVEKYSYKPGTSKAILAAIRACAEKLCHRDFDRLVVIGGETSQEITRLLKLSSLTLEGKPEPGLAEGKLHGGILDGKEFALKGGSIGSVEALEKMLCRWEG